MKIFRKFLWVLLLVFIAIQFFRPEKNISSGASPNDISQKFSVAEDVKQILTTSCYDCHSNNTRYPWYFSIQPVAWWLSSHIEEGKEHLNFDEFSSYRLRRQYKKLVEIKEMVEENEMPLASYTLIHRDAILSQEQKTTLARWTENQVNRMKAEAPPDSLLKK